MKSFHFISPPPRYKYVQGHAIGREADYNRGYKEIQWPTGATSLAGF